MWKVVNIHVSWVQPSPRYASLSLRLPVSSQSTKPLSNVGKKARKVRTATVAGIARPHHPSIFPVEIGPGRAPPRREAALPCRRPPDFPRSGLAMSPSPAGLALVPALAHLLFHGRAAGLEGSDQAVALLFEVLAALAEEGARLLLRFLRRRLRFLEPLLPVLRQKLAGLGSRLGRQQHRRGRSRDGAEEEPAQIACCVPTTLIRHDR